MQLSLIIPAYNEHDRLPTTLANVEDFFATSPIELCEVIVISDGSTDDTVSIAEAFIGRLPLKAIAFAQNTGKGAAVREGMLRAAGDFALFYDADGATPLFEIPQLFARLKESDADIAIGSRVHREGVAMQPHRRFIGTLFQALCAPLVPGIRDTACGCKLFKTEVAKELFGLQKIDRFAFDVEVLSLALQRGYKVVEVPVSWNAVPQSKVRLLRDGAEMFWCVLRLYWGRFIWRPK